MPISIQANIPSLTAQRNLGKTQEALTTSMARISSGLRVNSVKDFDASLVISQAMASKASAVAAQQNRSNAVGLAQTLEAGLSNTTDVLQRMRQLAADAANETTTAADRDSLNEEFSKLKSEAVSIAGGTSWNGEKWLTLDSGAQKNIRIGSAQLDQTQVALISNGDPDNGILTRSYGGFSLASSEAFNISGASSAEQRQGVLKALDGMISDTNTARHVAGAFQVEAAPSFTSMGPDDGLYTPAISRPSFDDFQSMSGNLLQAGRDMLEQAILRSNLVGSLLRG